MRRGTKLYLAWSRQELRVHIIQGATIENARLTDEEIDNIINESTIKIEEEIEFIERVRSTSTEREWKDMQERGKERFGKDSPQNPTEKAKNFRLLSQQRL